MANFLFKIFLLLLGKKRREYLALETQIHGETYTLRIMKHIDICEIVKKQIDELMRQGDWQ